MHLHRHLVVCLDYSTLTQCLLLISLFTSTTMAQLSATFYSSSCPKLETIVQDVMKQAVNKEARMGASVLRLFNHDCFVQGCDASILLDDGGEKEAGPNANSLRGFEVIDDIKTSLEASCPGVVSCADIIALAARDGTVLLGGPTWDVQLGRRDSTTGSPSLANTNLPGSSADLATLISMFGKQGLSPTDMTALSGAHTIGKARCVHYRNRIYADPNVNASFAESLKKGCPVEGGDDNLAPFDVTSPDKFDNGYYQDLVTQRGLLISDQVLFNNGSQDSLVQKYSDDAEQFQRDFVAAMIKMGNINILTGTAGQIRANCRVAGEATSSAKNSSSPAPSPPQNDSSAPPPKSDSSAPPPKSDSSSPPPQSDSPSAPADSTSPSRSGSQPNSTKTKQPQKTKPTTPSPPTHGTGSSPKHSSTSASSSAPPLLLRYGALWLSGLVSAYFCSFVMLPPAP